MHSAVNALISAISARSLPFATAVIAGIAAVLAAAPAARAAALREPDAGPPVELTIFIAPPPGTAAYCVEEDLPPGLVATAINANGMHDRYTQRIKWGPFNDDAARVLRARIVGGPGVATLMGRVSFDGADPVAIDGGNTLDIPDSATYFEGWMVDRLGASGSPADFPGPAFVPGGATLALLANYAFGDSAEDNPPVLVRDASGPEGGLVYRFRRDGRRRDIAYRIERSPNLEEWTEIQPEDYFENVSPVGEFAEDVAIILPAGGDGNESGAGFYRMRIDLSGPR